MEKLIGKIAFIISVSCTFLEVSALAAWFSDMMVIFACKPVLKLGDFNNRFND